MTTPPTPAGWYPDPDGTGGQRYWDGFTWTEHRSPAVDAPPAAAEPAAPAQTPGSEQPTAAVPTWTPQTGQRGGSHRRQDDEDEQFEPTPQVTEPVSERITPEQPPITPEVPSAPPPPPTAPEFDTPAPDEPLFGTPPPEGPAPDAPLFGASPPEAPPPEAPRYEEPEYGEPRYDEPRYDSPAPGTPQYGATPYDAPLSAAPLFDSSAPPQSAAPLFDSSAPPPAAGDNRKSVLTPYLAVCSALLLVLIAAIVYGFFIRDDKGVPVATPDLGTSTSQTSTESTETTTASTQAPTESATAVPGSEEATDGPISFTVHGVEMGSTVVSSDAPVEKTAVGQFVVVHMTVANVSADPATFVGMFQTLTAGGTTYNVDDEATAYLGGTFADLEPGATADVSIAFDVPADVQPETIQLHADPSTPGVEFTVS